MRTYFEHYINKYRNLTASLLPVRGMWLLLVLPSLFVSCADDEDTTPSMADKDRLETLIDTDIEKIVQFRNNFGTYILYNFDKNLDFAYQFEQASNWNDASLKPIDQGQARTAVDVLYEKIFSCYNDDYKKRMFPRKLLLVDEIKSSSELGLSAPVLGTHAAVANINSVTFAAMGDAANISADNVDAMHRALIADYLVMSRGSYPVDDIYFSYSQKNYSALMNSSRKNVAQILNEDPEFFYDRGFFNPDDKESTYFPSAQEDVLSYIRHMITMDKATADMLMDKPVMADKMHLITAGLQAMGVDVMKINPWTEEFISMEYVQPAIVYAEDVVTINSEATMNVTIIRGSKDLDRMVVNVNGTEQTIDLKAYDRMRIVVPVMLKNLRKGQNPVTLTLFVQGASKAAVVLNANATVANMENIAGFKIDMDNEQEEIYRTIHIYNGEGYPVDEAEVDPNLTTICFEKRGWMDRYYEEHDCDYRAWKLYKENGMVRTIMAYERGFNENYTALVYKHTHTYEFAYNEDNELQSVTLIPADGTPEVIVSDVTYAAGRIIQYSYKGKAYEPVYATANGATTRVDCLDAKMSRTCFGFNGDEYLNPYYVAGLPAVIPGDVAEVPLQLIYSQYIFNCLGTVWNSGWTTVEDGGAMAKQATVGYGGNNWTYTFVLKTE